MCWLILLGIEIENKTKNKIVWQKWGKYHKTLNERKFQGGNNSVEKEEKPTEEESQASLIQK